MLPCYSFFWVFGGSSLMLKRWRLAFNPDTDYFQLRHLWVLLPGLPLQLWNEGALRAIGNSLGKFISLDTQSLIVQRGRLAKYWLNWTSLLDFLIPWRSTGEDVSFFKSWITSEFLSDVISVEKQAISEALVLVSFRSPLLKKMTSTLILLTIWRPTPHWLTWILPPDPSFPYLSTLKPFAEAETICPSLFFPFPKLRRKPLSPSTGSPPQQCFPPLPSSCALLFPCPDAPSLHCSLPPICDRYTPPDDSLGHPNPPSPHPTLLSSAPPSPLDSEALNWCYQALVNLKEMQIYFPLGLNPSPSGDPLPELTALLPVYRGKELITPSAEAGPSSPHRNDGKAYAWSRGIGSELSPLQTRSSRKKKDSLSTQHSTSDLPLQDGKPLRAMKALARSKK
jgi:hypothetical protein